MEDSRDRAQRALEALEQEVLRAARMIHDLRHENEALRQQVAALGESPAKNRLAAHEVLDDEGRQWATERLAVAERLKTILGRFQWLEGGLR